MKMLSRIPLCVAVALIALTLAYRGVAQTKPAELVENPSFKAWSGCKAGTTTVMKGKTQSMGQDVDIEITTKLLDISDDKAHIEVTTVANANGMTMPQPARKVELSKMVSKDDFEKPGKGFDPALLETAKEESVTVPAGTFKAKLVEFTKQQQGMTMKVKSWFSPEVPGGTVKQEMNGEGEQKGQTISIETKMELATIDKK